MKIGSKPGPAFKTSAIALALSLFGGSAAAAGMCATPQEMSALRVSALRQQLMVAALQCREAGSFNRFILAHQAEFQDSDHNLSRFFARAEGARGDDAYNAFKTRLANDASLKSLYDGGFCARAEVVLNAALARGMSLTELASAEAPRLHTGYASCEREETADASAAPSFPARHRDLADSPPPAAVVAPAAIPAPTPVAAPAPGVTPPLTQTADATPAAMAPGGQSAPPAADGQYAENEDADAAGPDADDAPPPDTYREAYYARPGYPPPPYGNPWYGYGPQPMRQVMGPDGRWYLAPAY